MKETHRVNPMPAYDEYRVQMLPSRYEVGLKGADAQVHFRMQHWAIGSGENITSDTIVCDLHNLRVVIPPRAKMQPRTPSKRISTTDPFTPEYIPKRLRTQ